MGTIHDLRTIVGDPNDHISISSICTMLILDLSIQFSDNVYEMPRCLPKHERRALINIVYLGILADLYCSLQKRRLHSSMSQYEYEKTKMEERFASR